MIERGDHLWKHSKGGRRAKKETYYISDVGDILRGRKLGIGKVPSVRIRLLLGRRVLVRLGVDLGKVFDFMLNAQQGFVLVVQNI
jgi:hypothetical protein